MFIPRGPTWAWKINKNRGGRYFGFLIEWMVIEWPFELNIQIQTNIELNHIGYRPPLLCDHQLHVIKALGTSYSWSRPLHLAPISVLLSFGATPISQSAQLVLQPRYYHSRYYQILPAQILPFHPAVVQRIYTLYVYNGMVKEGLHVHNQHNSANAVLLQMTMMLVLQS